MHRQNRRDATQIVVRLIPQIDTVPEILRSIRHRDMRLRLAVLEARR